MSVTLYVDASRVFPDSETGAEHGTVGAWADDLAREHAIAGTEFSFKANGDVLDRTASVTSIDDGSILELIEVTVPDEPTTVEPAEPDPDDDTDTEPDLDE